MTHILHYDSDTRQEDSLLENEIPTLISEAKLFHLDINAKNNKDL